MKKESDPVEIHAPEIDELSACFRAGPISDDGKRDTKKHLVGYLGGVKIEVFSNEHGVPHFRAKHGGKSNSFRIADGEPLYPNGDLKTFF